MSNDEALRREAYHEAAHVVVLAAFGHRPTSATIVKGHGETTGPETADNETDAVWAVILFAGRAAEHRLSGVRYEKFDSYLQIGWLALVAPARAQEYERQGFSIQDEYRAMHHIAASLGRASSIADGMRFYEVTRSIVEALWPPITAMATALMATRELDGEAIARTLNDHDLSEPAHRATINALLTT